MSNCTCAVLKALRDMGFPDDLATKIRMERAVLTIQSFFRRSLFRVRVTIEQHSELFLPEQNNIPCGSYTYGQLLPHWNSRHTLHGSTKTFCGHGHFRHLFGGRYKPLGIVLKIMMKQIIQHKKVFLERKRRWPKRKKMFWKVTLMRRTKFFGDLPIISVGDELLR